MYIHIHTYTHIITYYIRNVCVGVCGCHDTYIYMYVYFNIHADAYRYMKYNIYLWLCPGLCPGLYSWLVSYVSVCICMCIYVYVCA